MNLLRGTRSDLNAQNEVLAKAFLANARHNPPFLIVTGIGFLAIYLLTFLGIFGQAAPQLIYVGLLTILLAIVQYLLLALARRHRGIAVNILGAIAFGIYGIALTYLWEDVVFFIIPMILFPPISALLRGFPRQYAAALSLILVLTIAAMFVVDLYTSVPRLQSNTPAAIAGFAFLVATGLLLATITIISGNRSFKSLQSLLLTSFIVIVAIPTIMATTLSTIGAYTTNQTQTFNTLKAISNLKASEVSTLIDDFERDTTKLQSDQGFTVNALSVLTDTDTDPSLLENSKRVVRSRAVTILGSAEVRYVEIMVLDTQGNVIISTIPGNEGLNYEKELFFRQGTLGVFSGFSHVASFGNANMIVATPIYGIDGRVIRGILALRSDASVIRDVMENTPGFENAETYLVDKNFRPVTNTRLPSNKVSTQASLEAILNNVSDGQDIYDNYNGQPVLGHYQWFDEMQVALIAEVPLDDVVANSVRSLIGSVILALFVIAIAITAVAISARSIVDPITDLAETTANFAAGKLSARASIDRQDEIGALARAYNFMAAQFQEIIGGLEQRVSDRTRDLESQTDRLRVTTEISRDVASARSLSELLERSSSLIRDRFGFDHVGIFLLDSSRQYAVLVASPTEAGKQMLANNFQLRVGEIGIIGRVAATGEARVSRNTESDPTYLHNPLLPNTRAEMALPLRAENKVIGVLDIQNETPNAFSEDVSIMQILADQLAAAIERTRLLQEFERSLHELEIAYGQYTRQNWKNVAENTLKTKLGYRFDNIRLESANEVPEIGKESLEKGTIVMSNGHDDQEHKQNSVAIPIKLRGQPIGVITLKLKEGYPDETISTIEQASERLAAALESARLYEEARLRADREQSISQIATAISSSSGYEEILQTTVREIGASLSDTEVSIQILAETRDNKQSV